ncbi:uncharacterized protein LOC128546986 [Mercenaria mercenaria]|uniref:uncharacterized protein LOC128546986 n=1 Tax=Mercenaria mercenaria TaxID=6596 RepID=UPI00234F13ED|nr:uncharacterized protein LOC128546986 [Mercenaria mercenaria]
MDFKEVENINKELIVKIKDKILLKELLHYLDGWGFSVMTIQGIRAEMNNHGDAYAVIQFMDAVKRRPRTFPKLVAALKDTKQQEIYDIFKEKIRKFYKNKQTRLAEVLSMISEEERQLGITEDHHDTGDVGSHDASSSGNVASSQSVLAGQTDGQSSSNSPSSDQWTQDIYRRDGHPPGRDPPNIPNWTDNSPAVQTPVRSNTRVSSSSSLSSVDNNSSGATGNTQNQFPSSDPPALDPTYAGASISSLKANVYKMLGEALEKKNTSDNEPWWNHIVNNGDLNVSRREQRQIGRHGSPGIEFLDILDDRDYTLQDLERLFIQFQITEALNVLRLHQNKVLNGRSSNQANANNDRNSNQGNRNNLNINQTPKADTNKELNISIPQTDAPEGPKEQNATSVQLLQKQASRQPEYNRSSSNVTELNRSSSNMSVTRLNSSASNQSFESNTDSNLSSMPSRDIEDESIKGTQPVQAHGDPAGTQSQPNPEDDAVKLRNDRIRQYDFDPGAIENTSYIAVNRQEVALNNNLPTGQTEGDVNVANMPCSQEGQMRNSEQPAQAGSGVNLPSERGGQDGSSSTSGIPFLSELRSMESNTSIEEPGGGVNNESQGVADIPPRSYITDDGMSSADLHPRSGVHYVPPSIESQSSREVTEESSDIQSGAFGNDESSGSLRDPDLIHGTQAAENMASDLTEENSVK